MDWKLVGFMACFMVPAFLILWYAMKQSDRLYQGLNDIHDKAKNALTIADLRSAYAELFQYSRKHCYHHHHMTRVKEIKAFIDGRISEFKQAVEIVVEMRSSDWQAYIKNDKACWGCGHTASAAIGDLVRVHHERFNIDVQYTSPGVVFVPV